MRMDKTTNSALALAALFAASVATSCSSDRFSEGENSGNGEGKSVTLTAKVNESDATTRVGMNKETDDAVSFYWHSNDAILVQTVNGSTCSGAKFTTETETGKDLAEFTGTVESGSSLGTYAVYPYSDKHSFTLDEQSGTSKTVLTYNLPATYTYDKVESGIFSNTDGTSTTYRSTSTNMPMVGTITGNAIEFKHIGGLAVIRIDQMPAETGTLTVTANQQLCGNFTISDLSADDAAITTSTATTDNKTVTFSFSGANTGGVGVFYLPLATGSYTNLTIKISYSADANTATQTIPYGSLNIACGEVVAIPLSTDIKGNLRHIVKNTDGTYTINGQTFVDLGLSMLWAATNIGAATAYDDGKYFAWGETNAKEGNYTTGNYTYTGNPTTLAAEDDAATANWGSACRMPTSTEFGELLDNCNWTWEDMTNSANETIKCYKGVSKNNSNIICFPTSGYCYDESNQSDRGSRGFFWSSTRDDNTWAFGLCLDYNNYPKSSYYIKRYYGCSVRPIAEKP